VNLTPFVRIQGNRVKREVRKTQHQNPEFGNTQGEIFKRLAKKVRYQSRGEMKLRKHQFW
jgi:hypothetical protein